MSSSAPARQLERRLDQPHINNSSPSHTSAPLSTPISFPTSHHLFQHQISTVQTTPTSSMPSSSFSNLPTTTPTMITTPTTTFMTSVATTVPTTIMSIDPYGSTITITTDISTTTYIPVPTPTPINNSTDTGGTIFIFIMLLIIFCYPRADTRRDKFRENLDPSRVVSHPSGSDTLPQVNLGSETEVTPYPDHGGSMRQYRESPFFTAGMGAAAAGAGIHHTTSPLSSPSQYFNTATSPGEGYPSRGFVHPGLGQYPQDGPNMSMQQADWHNPCSLTSPASSIINTSSSGCGMKERETAGGGRQELTLSTQQEVDGEGSGVVQHHDAGQAHSEEGGEEPRVY